MTQQRSFQFRLALAAFGLSAVLIVSFGTVIWFQVSKQFVRTLDSQLILTAERVGPMLTERRDWSHLRDRWSEAWPEMDSELRVLCIGRTDGTILYSRPGDQWLTEVLDPKKHLPDSDTVIKPREVLDHVAPPPGEAKAFTVKSPVDREKWRIVTLGNQDVVIYSGARLSYAGADEQSAKRFLVWIGVIWLLASALGGWWLGWRALRPIRRISETAAGVTAEGLSERISVVGDEYREFARLVENLNAMMARLENNFLQANRFTSDASHELKTPIALIQAEVDAALKTEGIAGETEESLVQIATEVSRLKQLTEGLLLLARADAGVIPVMAEKLNLGKMLAPLCEDTELFCELDGLEFFAEIPEEIVVRADRVLLGQAVQNLLSNAVKYNRSEGKVELWAGEEDEKVWIEVRNTGAGISKEDVERVFDRFYRRDPARQRNTGGFGLGLDLTAEIARAHGGDLSLVSGEPENTVFRLNLPIEEQAATEEPRPAFLKR